MLSPRDFDHRHASARSDDVNEFATVFGIEMHDDDKRRASIVRQCSEQRHQSMNAACGRADSDNDWQLIVGFIDRLWLVVPVRHNGTFFCQPDRATAYPGTREPRQRRQSQMPHGKTGRLWQRHGGKRLRRGVEKLPINSYKPWRGTS
jgi:hypothetical protein